MIKSFSDYMLESLTCQPEKRDMRNVLIADKLKVKDFIDSYVGKNDLFDHRIWAGYNPDLAICNIEFPCVIKANNAWHKIAFINKQTDIDDKLSDTLNSWLTYVGPTWEWYYKLIKPGFVIEKRMPDKHCMHRVYCFAGKAFMFFNQYFDITNGNLGHVGDTFYYANGDIIPVKWENSPRPIIPFDHELLISWAEKICKFPDGTPPFLRVDFYLVDGKAYFSEMTMLPDAASRHRFNPHNLDYELGFEYWKVITCS